MLKPILGLAATGVVAALLYKLLLMAVLPLAVGLVLLVVKLVFWGCALLFAVWLVRRLTRDRAGASA